MTVTAEYNEAAAASGAPQRSDRWPTGHLGWLFAGIAQFEGGVTTFLAEGAARGERLMLLSDDPNPDLWPRPLQERGDLVVASTTELYGPEHLVDPTSQRERFVEALDEAVRDGYSGVRVAADNSSLIVGQERLQAWLEWEAVADELMAHHAVTGLCALDRRRTDANSVRRVLERHHAFGPHPPS